MSDRVKVNSRVLKWARETARMSIEDAASKVPVSASRLEEWEDGSSMPTVRQAEILAKTYRRPFALFFLPDPPLDFQPLQDYRRADKKSLSTASTFIIREIQQKQAWIKTHFEENQENTLDFVGAFSMKDDPAKVARHMLNILDISPAKYNTGNPIREWINKAESKGIFISRTSFIHSKLKLNSEELQGFAIADNYAPFVFVNSDDWDAPQLFTLVHELAHVWIAASGISGDIEAEIRDHDKLHPVELFCNEVAANALMPVDIMRQMSGAVFNSFDKVFNASRRFGVSTFAFIYRVYALQMIDISQYRKLKREADHTFRQYVEEQQSKKSIQKEKEGGPNYFMLLVGKNSSLFTRVVLDAFRSGYIQPTEASSLLNTSTNNFPKLEAYLYR